MLLVMVCPDFAAPEQPEHAHPPGRRLRRGTGCGLRAAAARPEHPAPDPGPRRAGAFGGVWAAGQWCARVAG
ncbi:hypothetical protein GCM10020229_56750 [Kitasatospora albolonga]